MVIITEICVQNLCVVLTKYLILCSVVHMMFHIKFIGDIFVMKLMNLIRCTEKPQINVPTFKVDFYGPS
jgi:hypothetical protein